MTYKDLLNAILSLSEEQQMEEALVYTPLTCGGGFLRVLSGELETFNNVFVLDDQRELYKQDHPVLLVENN